MVAGGTSRAQAPKCPPPCDAPMREDVVVLDAPLPGRVEWPAPEEVVPVRQAILVLLGLLALASLALLAVSHV